MSQPDAIRLHDALPHVPVIVSGAYLARPGNLVRPLVNGVPAFRRIAEAIAFARHSIWLTVAFYAHDFRFRDGAGTMFDLLDRAAVRGLDVRCCSGFRISRAPVMAARSRARKLTWICSALAVRDSASDRTKRTPPSASTQRAGRPCENTVRGANVDIHRRLGTRRARISLPG